MTGVTGLQHVTCIAGDAQDNVDFYSGVLGMRLVKKSVNQDSPGTYHLFYADGAGHPGTDITFFPWPEMPPARPGVGLGMEVWPGIRLGATDSWGRRTPETGDDREFTPWADSPVPAERQIRGLHSVRLWERDLALTTSFLTGVLGFV